MLAGIIPYDDKHVKNFYKFISPANHIYQNKEIFY